MNIAIIGVGLIGGSIGLSLKKNKLCSSIIGFGRDKKRLKEAKDLGIIDKIGENFNELKRKDVIFLCCPVLSIIEIGKEISPFIKGSIVSDVGSTKGLIVKELSPLIKRFVGAHPMAGSHKSGIKNASDRLFVNSTIVLTPNEHTEKDALNVISSLWKGMGADVIEMDPDYHDKLVALSSHIPHIASNVLIELILKKKDALPLISSGFRDMTRLSLSSPLIWYDIFQTNKKHIIKGLDIMEKHIIKWKMLMDDKKRLINKLKQINRKAKYIRKEVDYGEDR